MREVGAVISALGTVTYWHEPDESSSITLPDSRKLWDEIQWLHLKGQFAGFAHTHPGRGHPAPSHTDLTTFSAIERALGIFPTWWIASETHLVAMRRLTYKPTPTPGYYFHAHDSDGYLSVDIDPPFGEPILAPWAAELRRRSNY